MVSFDSHRDLKSKQTNKNLNNDHFNTRGTQEKFVFMASLENLLEKSGSAFPPHDSGPELSVIAPVTKVEHWIWGPLEQKSTAAHPIQVEGRRDAGRGKA